ncbi:MAG: histidinol dehydrogenase, partial [Spirochaetales bacterium]|nr:histidinol dehydrogenase [Spirochaetales bacterium]
MIPWYKNPDKNLLAEILSRPKKQREELQTIVRSIIDRVNSQGDAALFAYAKKFDGVELNGLIVSRQEIEAAEYKLDQELKDAIKLAKKNIAAFHAAQKNQRVTVETQPGVVCWRESRPIDKIGIYIPGGTAPLFSTVLMLAVPAVIAGCTEIVLITPANQEGKVHPAVLYAAKISGVTRCVISGGAQAIAALAYGTESVPKVDKIFGPGNQYVTMAKQMVSVDKTAIDMPAGPSEVMVVADEWADPAFSAADLLSQAEHGSDSQSILVTTSPEHAGEVQKQLQIQIDRLPRRMLAVQSLSSSAIIQVDTIEQAIILANQYAPEHLILNITDAAAWLGSIKHAGSVFLGPWTPESAGDYASGTNHTLPTSGWAVSCSGVGLDSYLKHISFQ